MDGVSSQPDCRLSIVDSRFDDKEDQAASIGNRQSQIDNSPRGGFVFWLLIAMGLATFTPCVLLPEWREYQALRLAEQHEQHRLDGLRRAVERERQMVDAVQSDPAVIARVAQRDLHFYRPGDTTVAVDVPLQATNEEAFTPQAIELPRSMIRAGAYLPSFNYDAVFCDPRTRPIVMGLSVGLVLCACAIFWNRRAPNSR